MRPYTLDDTVPVGLLRHGGWMERDGDARLSLASISPSVPGWACACHRAKGLGRLTTVANFAFYG